jgi:benzylsuccinate CoA-transferase BbsF subunit
MVTLPLQGIRITDFSWLGAGSYATKMLADMGADVIKIESSTRLDSLRMGAPYKDGKPGVNRSGYFADRNTSKRSVTLDMKHPRALGLIRKLIEQSDIVANNFTPGVMEKFGLGYPQVSAMKPDIIYLAMSMQGAEGPERDYLGYGSSIVSLTGLQHLTGIPAQLPRSHSQSLPRSVCTAGRAALPAPHRTRAIHRPRATGAHGRLARSNDAGPHGQRPQPHMQRQSARVGGAPRRVPVRR